MIMKTIWSCKPALFFNNSNAHLLILLKAGAQASHLVSYTCTKEPHFVIMSNLGHVQV